MLSPNAMNVYGRFAPIGGPAGTASSKPRRTSATGSAGTAGAVKNGGRLAASTAAVRGPSGTPATVKRPSAALWPEADPNRTITPGTVPSSPASRVPFPLAS
jgi:hypothetical protein